MFECNVYPYGSYVYGTATENSDEDAIVVCDKFSKEEIANIFDELDVTCYTSERISKAFGMSMSFRYWKHFSSRKFRSLFSTLLLSWMSFKLRSSCAAKGI